MVAWFILLILGPFVTLGALFCRHWTIMIIYGLMTICAYLPFFPK